MKQLLVYVIIGVILSFIYWIYWQNINEFIVDLMFRVASLKCYLWQDTMTFIWFIIITLIIKAIIYSFYKKAE
jgi:hypothetical protein